MPTYEFWCHKCKALFSTVCMIEERNQPKPCPKCSVLTTDRRISLFSDKWNGRSFEASDFKDVRKLKDRGQPVED